MGYSFDTKFAQAADQGSRRSVSDLREATTGVDPFSSEDAGGEIDPRATGIISRGGTDRPTGRVFIRIRPGLTPEQLKVVLDHELGHLAHLWKDAKDYRRATRSEAEARQLIETALLMKEIEESKKAQEFSDAQSRVQQFMKSFWRSVDRLRQEAEDLWKSIKEKRKKKEKEGQGGSK